jgi:hypothetical protein
MHKFISNYLKGVVISTVTLPSGTIITDETTGKLYVHDGVTAGGIQLTSGTTALPSATASQLYGGTGAAGTAIPITLGTNLALSGTTLNATVISPSATTPNIDGTATIGSLTTYARADHIHPTDTSRASVASPSLSGTPLAPTATGGTNTTQIATTAFVTSAVNILTSNQYTLQWTGGAVVTNGTYYYSLSAPYPGTIISATYITAASTSFIANVQIAGTSVTSLSAVTVSSATAATTTATAANTFTAGQTITLIITSATSSPTNAVFGLLVTVT